MENTDRIDEDYIKNQEDDEQDIDYDELTSHKIEKNVMSLKKKKRVIVILEHAYLIY
jgi:hypothetical protein